jgi:hypothetical protein
MEEEATPVPPQYREAAVTDFRRAALGPTGFKMCRKRKMEEYQEQVCVYALVPRAFVDCSRS